MFSADWPFFTKTYVAYFQQCSTVAIMGPDSALPVQNKCPENPG